MATHRDPLDPVTRPWERLHTDPAYRPRHGTTHSVTTRYDHDRHLVVLAVNVLAVNADDPDTIRLYRELHRRGALTVRRRPSITAEYLIAREAPERAA